MLASREGCQSPSPKVVCTLYRHTANDSQGMCTVCTLSLVVATILVNSKGGNVFWRKGYLLGHFHPTIYQVTFLGTILFAEKFFRTFCLELSCMEHVHPRIQNNNKIFFGNTNITFMNQNLHFHYLCRHFVFVPLTF